MEFSMCTLQQTCPFLLHLGRWTNFPVIEYRKSTLPRARSKDNNITLVTRDKAYVIDFEEGQANSHFLVKGRYDQKKSHLPQC